MHQKENHLFRGTIKPYEPGTDIQSKATIQE